MFSVAHSVVVVYRGERNRSLLRTVVSATWGEGNIPQTSEFTWEAQFLPRDREEAKNRSSAPQQSSLASVLQSDFRVRGWPGSEEKRSVSRDCQPQVVSGRWRLRTGWRELRGLHQHGYNIQSDGAEIEKARRPPISPGAVLMRSIPQVSKRDTASALPERSRAKFRSHPAILQTLRCTVVTMVRSEDPDLSFRQLAVLLTCYLTSEEQTVRGLAAELSISKPAVSRALDRLSGLSLLRRKSDPSDGRSVLVGLTSAGNGLVKDLLRTMQDCQ